MTVDGKPIPFSYNSTISYSPEGKQDGSLYHNVHVTAVDISRPHQTDALKVDVTSSVEKGNSLVKHFNENRLRYS